VDTGEGRPLARSEDKYRRVCRKLIHHHAYRTKPHLTTLVGMGGDSLLNCDAVLLNVDLSGSPQVHYAELSTSTVKLIQACLVTVFVEFVKINIFYSFLD
jgi:hypothetical protein